MKISNIINQVNHRPWTLPTGGWKYYQEWNNALFLHWEVPIAVLEELVPENLTVDTFQGKAYVSLVAFTMEKIRPRFLPAVSYISDFHEINVRTYIDNGGRKGVYFLNIEAEKTLSAIIARKLSGLPYEKAVISRDLKSYVSNNHLKKFALSAEFEIQEQIIQKTELDKWLTERYCLYVEDRQQLYRYEIHHHEWKIQNVDISSLKVDYKIGSLDLGERPPDLSHYSEGVKVLAWGRTKI